MQTIQALWNNYGYLFIGTYFGVYFITLGSSFVLVHSGWLQGPDLNAWLHSSFLKVLEGQRCVPLFSRLNPLCRARRCV